MLRYKNAKNKSNYVSVKIKSGVDLDVPAKNGLGETRLMSGECNLVFWLVPGEHMASASYDAGVINGKQVVGEVRVHYAYKDERICVCEYDFKHKGYYEAPPHYTRPEFHLYEKTEEDNKLYKREPLLVVSANRNVKHTTAIENTVSVENIFSAKNREFSKALDKIQARLRTVYNKISDALSGRKVFLSVHIDDFIEKDENGTPVNGKYVDKVDNWCGKFINVVGSSRDEPKDIPAGIHITNWIEYYSYRVCNNTEYYKTTRCASNNYGLCCYYRQLTNNIGGHILLNEYAAEVTYVSSGDGKVYTAGLNREAHLVNEGGNYNMLPICSRHNSHHKWDVAMYVPSTAKHTLLYLNGFIPVA